MCAELLTSHTIKQATTVGYYCSREKKIDAIPNLHVRRTIVLKGCQTIFQLSVVSFKGLTTILSKQNIGLL